MMRANPLLSLVALVGVVQPATPVSGPLEVIQASNGEILGLYAEADTLDADAEAHLYDTMNEVTSFDVMAANAIDRYCQAVDPTLCQEFKDTFVRLLQVSAVTRLGRYRAERFEYLDELVENDTASVETLAFYADEQIELDYHLERIDGEWKIVDYDVDGVGTVANYRRQFRRLLRRETMRDVIGRLERRIADYEAEAP